MLSKKFFRRKSFLGKLDHLRRGVRAGDRTARNRPGNFRRDFSIAAADIKNVFIAAQIKPGDEFTRPALLHGGIRRVIRRIPFR